MHPNRKFHLAEPATMRALVREIGFGLLTVLALAAGYGFGW